MSGQEKNSRCLCCGLDLGDSPGHNQWHRACARKFFGSDQVPDLDISTTELERFARLAVGAGTTVAGVQKKLSLHLEAAAGRKRLTLIGYPAGYILKPPVPEYPDLPELEDSLLRLAEKAGIRTVPHGLIRLKSGELAYITRRIDRIAVKKNLPKAGKIGMEDFCQLSERLTEDKYKGSYERCGKIIRQFSARPGLDCADFFYLLLFSFVSGNADMHLKNFSLVEASAGWILAPAYDLVPTKLLLSLDLEETALTLNGKKSRLTRDDFVGLGESLGLVPKVTQALLDKAAALPDLLLPVLDRCFLPDSRRAELTELIRGRAARLSGEKA